MTDHKSLPKHAWVNCREDWTDSFALGDVVVDEVNIRETAEENSKSNPVLGKLEHGTLVNVLDQKVVGKFDTVYYKISKDKLIGWIKESFLAWQWASYTFIGNFKPAEVCKNLDIKLNRWGTDLIIYNNAFSISTEGDPNQFKIIYESISRLVIRIVNAQSPLTQMPLQAEFTNWVEVPIGESESRWKTVGFPLLDNKDARTISNSHIERAYLSLTLMELSPYFDLALSDYHQALQYPQHALIFLSRAIESIENHFSSMAKQNKGKGKEAIMRELLRVDKDDVEYVTKRANASHRRHASRDATAESLPDEELTECFRKTANIISAFAKFIKPLGS